MDEDIHYRAVGILLVRLAFVPGLGLAELWEIRDDGDTLSAYRSRGTQPGEPKVVGHERLPVEQAALRRLVDRIAGQSVPLRPAAPTFGIADAHKYVATIFMGFSTSCRVEWCDGREPEEWRGLVGLMSELRGLLGGAASPSVDP